jgi:hypothetical protein
MRQLGIARSYDDLHRILRERWDALNVPADVLDQIAGTCDRFLVKVLGPGKTKSLGRISLTGALGALAVQLIVVEDEAQLRRIQSRLTRRRWGKRKPLRTARENARRPVAAEAPAQPLELPT